MEAVGLRYGRGKAAGDMMPEKKTEAFEKLITKASVALVCWATAGQDKQDWALPGPGEGEAFKEWSARASAQLWALSIKAESLGSQAPWGAALASFAKGAIAGYPLSMAVGWCAARGESESSMDKMGDSAWEIEMWGRSHELERDMSRVENIRADKGLPLPSLFDGQLHKSSNKWLDAGRAAVAATLSIPLAPLGWGAGLASMAVLRKKGWARMAKGLRAASQMMGAEELACGGPSPERVFEGWLDAAKWLGHGKNAPGLATLRALQSYEASSMGRPLGLVRDTMLGWGSMGRLTDGDGLEAELLRRKERETELAAESGVSLAHWSLVRAEPSPYEPRAKKTREEAREQTESLADVAAGWWREARAEKAFEPRALSRVAHSVAKSYLDAGEARHARDAQWVDLGRDNPSFSSGVARADMEAAWVSVQESCSAIKERGRAMAWPSSMAKEVAIEAVAAGVELEWAKLRLAGSQRAREPKKKTVPAPVRAPWSWTADSALVFSKRVSAVASGAVAAAGLGPHELLLAFDRAMERGYGNGMSLYDALAKERVAEELQAGFAQWEDQSLRQCEAGVRDPKAKPRSRL
jgi:hypothetical protein